MGNNLSVEDIPKILKQPRMAFYALIFMIDVYDTYLHEYPPAPTEDEIHKVTEKGAFAKVCVYVSMHLYLRGYIFHMYIYLYAV